MSKIYLAIVLFFLFHLPVARAFQEIVLDQNKVTVIITKKHFSELSDTVLITYKRNLSDPPLTHKVTYSYGTPAIFSFGITKSIGSIKIAVKGESSAILHSTYVEGRDNIIVNIIGKGKETFGEYVGQNSEKFKFQGILDSISLHSGFFLDSARMYNPDYIRTIHQYSRAIWESEINLLNSRALNFSKELRDLYKADIDGEFFSNANGFSSRLLRGTHFDEKLLPVMKDLLKISIDTNLGPVSLQSWKFLQGIQNQIKLEFAINNGKIPDILEVYNALKTQMPKKWREASIYYFLKRIPSGRPEDLEKCIKDAILILRDTTFKKTLLHLLNTRSKGIKAYNFSLLSTENKLIGLSDFKGKVVLLDFWFTNCPGCLNLSKVLDREVLPQFNGRRDFKYITINIDTDKKVWLNSIDSGKYTKKKYVNLYTNGQGSQSDVINQYKVSAFPTLILIDKNGNILNANIDSFDASELNKQIIDAFL